MKDDMKWEEYLGGQVLLHPSIMPQDIAKLCYQAAFGGEHLLSDPEGARRYLLEEYEQVPARKEPLWEEIHRDVCRINLGAWKKRDMPVEWLFKMFASVESLSHAGGEAAFWEYRKVAEGLLEKGFFSFDRSDWDAFWDGYTKPVPVHHSETYRRAEAPAYRVVCSRLARILPILEALCQKGEGERPAGRAAKIVAIDGRCASGKSTMAGQLAQVTGAGLVHMDDFFLPEKLRTQERLHAPGGNVHYERVLREVIPKLRSGKAFSYGRFDCSRMEVAGERLVPEGPFRILEGAYSCHPALGDYMDIRVFSHVEAQEQLERIGRRDGEQALERFCTRWIPMEENYFAAFAIRESADICV